METVREIKGRCLYVFEGICSANTHFIENKRESDQFIKFIGRYLGDYVKVLDFSISKNGWILLVRTKSEITVKNHYIKKHENNKKLKEPLRLSVWEIISNAIRLMRSHFTRWTNDQRSRRGNASMRVYRRYLFSNVEEARQYVEKVRKGVIDLEQKNPRYQANSNHFDEDGQISINVSQMSSPIYRQTKNLRKVLGIEYLKVNDYLNDQLELWIRKTCVQHGVMFIGHAKVRIKVRGS